jgi:hypothetical protein
MLYSKDRSLEDQIIEILILAPSQIKNLHEELCVQNPSIRPLSLRAVYKAVNNLVGAGVLLKVGKVVRIDEEWARGLRSMLNPAASKSRKSLGFLSSPDSPPQIGPVSPGEKMSHSFTSMSHLDSFWKTIVFQLEGLEKDGEVFFYNPHNFWLFSPDRLESEKAYYAHFEESKVHAFFTVGGDSTADREFKRHYQNEYFQVDARPLPSLPRTHHITLIGNYLITVKIAKSMAQNIDNLYSSQLNSLEIAVQLKTMYQNPLASRFILENNPLKAKKLRKTLSMNFYFKDIHA